MNDYYKSIDWLGRTKSVHFIQMAHSDIIVSLHLVIPFISVDSTLLENIRQ